jgi:hypothetical protein
MIYDVLVVPYFTLLHLFYHFQLEYDLAAFAMPEHHDTQHETGSDTQQISYRHRDMTRGME